MNSCMQLLNMARQPRIIQRTLHIPTITKPACKFSSSCNKKRKALIFLTKGYEEIEVVTPVDVLRRGGVDVTIAGLKGKKPQKSVNRISIKPDKDLDDVCGPFDAVLMTGDDKATDAMSCCERVKQMLKEQEKCGKIIAAICTGPLVLMEHGICKNKCLTSHPDCEKKLRKCGDYKYKCKDVVVDDFLITARGPAQTMQWALTILMHLTDEYNACCIAKTLLVK